MSVRLALYQRESRPLEGLCAQLQCAGHHVFECHTEGTALELINDSDIDVLLLDADAEQTKVLLERVRTSATVCNLPMMLIAEKNSTALSEFAADAGIDDVIILPILRDDLRTRVRNLARLNALMVEFERRLKTFSDFGITKQDHQMETTANKQFQVLLVGSMDEREISLIDMLGETATFTYAATTDHAWHQLLQSYVDAVIVTNKVATSDIRGLCRRARASVNLSDLPILVGDIGDDLRKQAEIGTICHEFNVDHLRAPYQPVVTRKRLRAMIRRHRLKSRLRGLMTDDLYSSTVDNLTGLYGRGFLYAYLEQSIQESRARGFPLSVATCAISGLADVNATLGYPAGDQLIGQLGRALARGCRAQDLIARVRGASFGVVLKNMSESEARTVCERLARILEEITKQSQDYRLSHVHLTIGLAEMTANDGAETLIERALQQPSTVALCKAS